MFSQDVEKHKTARGVVGTSYDQSKWMQGTVNRQVGEKMEEDKERELDRRVRGL